MADYIEIADAAATARKVAADEIAGVHHQRHKMQHGADGSAVDVSAANPMPVTAKFTEAAQLDAFGRMRVSNPTTLFDSKQIHDNQPLYWDDQEVSGSGTASAHSVNEARTRISVSNLTAGRRVRQTFMRFNYQPGKSQLVLMTARMSAAVTGIKGSVGMFDDQNGLFFTNDGGTLKAVCRSYVTGSAVDTEVAQASWNGDTLDGNGASGITLDVTKTQILWFDMEWLGVGDVRMGFIIDGQFILAHTFHNTNVVATVYMSTPNLPLRYEIENDGTGVAADLDHICSTVISEGGQDALGTLLCHSSGNSSISASVEDTIYPVVGIRLKSTHLGARVDFVTASLIESAGNKNIEWMFLLNPNVTGTFTYSAIDNSACEGAIGGTATATGGTQVGGSFFSSANRGGGDKTALENAIRLGAAIDGTQDELILCVRPIGVSNCVVHGSIAWREMP